MTDRTEAPWTAGEVAALNRWQQRPDVHPFTCPNRGDGAHRGEGELLATAEGWTCPDCDYTQSWAHRAMLELPPPRGYLIGRDHELIPDYTPTVTDTLVEDVHRVIAELRARGDMHHVEPGGARLTREHRPDPLLARAADLIERAYLPRRESP